MLGTLRNATVEEGQAAVDAAKAAAPMWRELSFDDRAAILLKAAELLSGPWRARLNAATMLGQSKTAYQAEIDAACELIDFWRFNVHFARQILEQQPPLNAKGIWNRSDYRSLEGFVYAVTPFNFTAIAGNLPTAPALMGNTVVWKPSPTQQLAAQLTMELLEEAGMPPGVINMVTGDGINVCKAALRDADLAGIHFTGSTPTFQHLWHEVGTNLDRYRTYPRLVGETGGKDFILAHPSADPAVLRTAMIRGAFEFQGQKCSAASRAYVPRLGLEADQGRPRRDHQRPDARATSPTCPTSWAPSSTTARSPSTRTRSTAPTRPRASTSSPAAPTTTPSATSCGRRSSRSRTPPTSRSAPSTSARSCRCTSTPTREYDTVLDQMERFAPFALTGSIIAQDRRVIADATQRLRFAAGNFYVNDKPTGAVVGQQPFGGGRASGTNDKAGAAQNLLRWTSVRSIKETFVPPTDHAYPHMG